MSISQSFLKSIFSGYTTPGGSPFLPSTIIWPPCFWSALTVIQIVVVPLYVIYHSFWLVSKLFSLHHWLSAAYDVSRCSFLWIYPARGSLSFLNLYIYVTKFGEFFCHCFFKFFGLHFSFCLCGMPIIHLLDLLTLFYRSLKLCSLFSILFFFVLRIRFLLICLKVHSHFPVVFIPH